MSTAVVIHSKWKTLKKLINTHEHDKTPKRKEKQPTTNIDRMVMHEKGIAQCSFICMFYVYDYVHMYVYV